MSQMVGIELEIWSFIFALIAIAIAIGKEVILPLWIKAKIKVFYDNDDECISSSPFKDNETRKQLADSTWLRLKIVNNGNRTAKGCYVKLTAIRDNTGNKIKPFDPCPLKWTIFHTDKIDLAKKEYHLVGLAYQSEGNDFFIPATRSLPNSLLDNIKKLSSNKFKLNVTVYGDNIEPVSEQIEIIVSQDYKKLRFNLK